MKQTCPPGRVPLLVAHNGKNFDFKALQLLCSAHNPSLCQGWHWLDTLRMMSKHSKVFGRLTQVISMHGGQALRPCGCFSSSCQSCTVPEDATVQETLREFYRIQAPGAAHRALTDCITLAKVLPCLLRTLAVDTVAQCKPFGTDPCLGDWPQLSGMLLSLARPLSASCSALQPALDSSGFARSRHARSCSRICRLPLPAQGSQCCSHWSDALGNKAAGCTICTGMLLVGPEPDICCSGLSDQEGSCERARPGQEQHLQQQIHPPAPHSEGCQAGASNPRSSTAADV